MNFSCIWSNRRNTTFATPIEIPPKHVYWIRPPSFQVSKNADFTVYFCAEPGPNAGWHIKSIFWVLKAVDVSVDVWVPALSWWRVIGLRKLVFPRYLYRQITNSWLCTTNNILFCVVVLIRLQLAQFFNKKQATIYLEMLRKQTTFIGIVSSLNNYCLLSDRCHRRVSRHPYRIL